MKFCDKLPKLRKDNNLSQELLADKLGVSRQAVSKWESGSSYPDMEKMIEMCKILNCTLEDLLDDGAVKENSSSNNTKINFSSYFNDFLKFITRIYNMFCAMKFKDKIKCLLELCFIVFILWIIGMIIYAFFDSFLFNLLLNIPYVGIYLNAFFENVFIILLVVVGAIVLFHLFKIRYLDYYVTVEDQNIEEKVLEKPCLEKNSPSLKQNKEKIIIRDPKHSKSSFFDLLARAVVAIIKVMFLVIMIFCVITFIALVMGLFMGIYHIKYGIIFLFTAVAFLGLLSLNYVLIELIFNFIISKKQNFKRIFIIIIAGLFFFGAGLGLATCTYLGFDKTSVVPEEYLQKDEVVIKMKDNLVLNSSHISYKIDNSVKDIKLTSEYSLEKICLDEFEDINNYDVLDVYFCSNDYKLVSILYDDIKNKKTRDYEKLYSSSIVASLSLDNYNKIIKNNKKYATYYDGYE
ncbi:MAG: helix-turn-helix transcriptional regulator [Bacilli bacterium]